MQLSETRRQTSLIGAVGSVYHYLIAKTDQKTKAAEAITSQNSKTINPVSVLVITGVNVSIALGECSKFSYTQSK